MFASPALAQGCRMKGKYPAKKANVGMGVSCLEWSKMLFLLWNVPSTTSWESVWHGVTPGTVMGVLRFFLWSASYLWYPGYSAHGKKSVCGRTIIFKTQTFSKKLHIKSSTSARAVPSLWAHQGAPASRGRISGLCIKSEMAFKDFLYFTFKQKINFSVPFACSGHQAAVQC